jgi:hypothetical protein
MVVYYLWLILPFWQKLEILAFGKKEPPSPFLWPKVPKAGKAADSVPFSNARLGYTCRRK